MTMFGPWKSMKKISSWRTSLDILRDSRRARDFLMKSKFLCGFIGNDRALYWLLREKRTPKETSEMNRHPQYIRMRATRYSVGDLLNTVRISCDPQWMYHLTCRCPFPLLHLLKPQNLLCGPGHVGMHFLQTAQTVTFSLCRLLRALCAEKDWYSKKQNKFESVKAERARSYFLKQLYYFLIS